eukprot:TRINITY_DN4878_c0_g2_i1.p1 TRINITY_DN4878_c0_g2~~TRINITY_DN4878_c0_g2_i1.p1  ORF type:complete len:327 (-),score=65.18 TRINITY_DN4878_c0_g2_i1:46-1026(-)
MESLLQQHNHISNNIQHPHSHIHHNTLINNNNNQNELNGNEHRILGMDSFVRKCSGRNKAVECLQGSNHPNTRWECSFGSINREEFLKHCKNISKRSKWKDLIESVSPDKDSLYRCVYHSTDRCHVENHYDKGSNEFQFSNGLKAKQLVPRGQFNPRNHSNFKGGKRNEFEGDEVNSRDMKKMRQDASLLQSFAWHENGGSINDPDSIALPDSMRIEELLEQIEKKLHLPHEMITNTLQKMTLEGFIIIGTLRSLKREGWSRLNLPIALEEELKTQLANKLYNPYYVPGSPLWNGAQGNASNYWPTQGNYSYGESDNSQKEDGSDE